MKYTDEEIIAYARSRIQFIDQQKGKRLVLGFMGIGVIAMFILLIQMIKEKSEKSGANVLLDDRFLAGIAIGILILMSVGFGALAVVRMFDGCYGKEIEAYRLLVRLKDERSG